MLNLISVISDLFAEFVDDISILLYELYYTSYTHHFVNSITNFLLIYKIYELCTYRKRNVTFKIICN